MEEISQTRAIEGEGADAPVSGLKSTPRVARIPVRCPRCGMDTVMKCHWLVVTTALHRWNQMKLHAACCAVSWDASAAELAGIRKFVGLSGDGG